MRKGEGAEEPRREEGEIPKEGSAQKNRARGRLWFWRVLKPVCTRVKAVSWACGGERVSGILGWLSTGECHSLSHSYEVLF